MTIPLKVAELDHVVLRCRDQKRAYDFYTRVLGLIEERRIDQIGLVQLRAGRSMLDLVPAAPAGEGGSLPRDENSRNVDHVCLGIEASDMNAVAEYLRAQSVTVMGEPTTRYGAHGNGLSLYIRDTEGNVVELKQLAPPS